ncbi:MAG: DUF4349 domain-containing protein [Actinomycetota bacterium]|nr:DUF4349 domain-containing protein [Actinomycetota bacterium]
MSTSSGRMARTAILIALALALLSAAGCALASRDTATTDSGVKGDYPSQESVTSPYGAPTADELKATDSAVSPPEMSRESVGGVSGTGTDASRLAAADRLVIKTGSMRLRVDDVNATVSRIRTATTAAGGSITDLQVSTDEATPIYRTTPEGMVTDGAPLSAFITVRVPNKEFDRFSDKVAGFGKVLRQSDNQSDVTQEHIDLAARLKNLQAEEVRLRGFFDKAKNVTEMIAVQQELARVRGEIESMQAQIFYLERQAAMATLAIELVEPEPVVRPAGTDWGFAAAVRDGIRGAAAALRAMIALTISLSPFIAIGIVVFFVTRTILRRRHRRVSAILADEASDTVEVENASATGVDES